MDRIGGYLQTFTGNRFYPLDPRVDEVRIEDIAHALALQCRYGGHVLRFYSVAEHCWHLSYTVPPEYALEALMHDAAEAYIVDVPRPIKRSLEKYYTIEANIERKIAERYKLTYPFPAIVMEYDTRMIANERAVLMRDAGASVVLPEGTEPLPGVRPEGWHGRFAEQQFQRRFDQLQAVRHA